MVSYGVYPLSSDLETEVYRKKIHRQNSPEWKVSLRPLGSGRRVVPDNLTANATAHY